MKVAEGQIGRVFVLRLEDGDRMPECLERFAAEKGVKQGFCSLIGGIGSGQIVVGPEDGPDGKCIMPPKAMLAKIIGEHEVAAVGTLFPDESGTPKLHMHGAFGRKDETLTGCIRPGIDVWTIGELVLIEFIGLEMERRRDPATGFELLEVK